MSIRSIEDSKILQKYCKKLGREGVALRIKEIATEIVKGDGEYQSTLMNAGKIRALAMGSIVDSYWGEKQSTGYHDMLEEAQDKTV